MGSRFFAIIVNLEETLSKNEKNWTFESELLEYGFIIVHNKDAVSKKRKKLNFRKWGLRFENDYQKKISR